MTGTACHPDPAPDANVIEKADVALAQALAPVSRTPLIKFLGTLSEIGDQPEMRVLCAGVIAAGLLRGDTKMAGTGFRMLLAHSLATGAKSAIKHRFDRTRPTVLVEEGRYEAHAGSSREHDESSVPSGHTAGAVAVAGTFARDYPEYRGLAYAAAAAVSLMQIPRCKHYPSDVGAGAAIGAACAAGINALDPKLTGG